MSIAILIALILVAGSGGKVEVTGDPALGKRLGLIVIGGRVLVVAVLAFVLLVLERGWP